MGKVIKNNLDVHPHCSSQLFLRQIRLMSLHLILIWSLYPPFYPSTSELCLRGLLPYSFRSVVFSFCFYKPALSYFNVGVSFLLFISCTLCFLFYFFSPCNLLILLIAVLSNVMHSLFLVMFSQAF